MIVSRETWKKISGWERYSVSDYGRVRNDETGRVRKPGQSRVGRRRVILHRDGYTQSFLVYRLVLTAFVGPCPAGMEACHNDGNPANDRLENLRWDTRESNEADKLKHGTHSRGERQGASKLTEEQAYAIKFGNIPGTLDEVGAMFGISTSNVCGIRTGERWHWLKKKI